MDEKDIFGYDASENVSISKIAECYSGLSARKLNNFLGKCGVIYRDKETKSWIVTDKYKDVGYAVSEITVFKDVVEGHTYLLWTGKGREFIYQLIKDEYGLLPNSKNGNNTGSDVKIASNDTAIVEDSDGCISILDFVHILSKNGILVGGRIPHQNNVFETLREKGFLNKTRGLYWNTPYRDFDCFGYFKVVKKRTPKGKFRYVTRLTPKGQAFFLRYFKKLMDDKDSVYGKWGREE